MYPKRKYDTSDRYDWRFDHDERFPPTEHLFFEHTSLRTARLAGPDKAIHEYINELGRQALSHKPGRPLETTRARIDQGIACLDTIAARLHDLKSARNMLAPINARLPVEVFCRIFSMCAEQEPGMRWVRLLTVCTYWRSIIYGHSPMWSNIYCSSPGFVRGMLDRAKIGPLTIRTPIAPANEAVTNATVVCLNIALRYYPTRIRRMCLDAKLFHDTRVINSELMWALEDLQITCGGNTLPIFRRVDIKTIFCSCMPMLRRLTVVGCCFDSTLPTLKNVTHLEVHNLHPTARNTQDILTVIKKLPCLQNLAIIDSLGGSSRDEEPLELFLLTHLCLRGTGEQCSAFMGAIIISRMTRLKIECIKPESAPRWELEPYASIRNRVATHLQLISMSYPILSLCMILHTQEPRGMTIRAYADSHKNPRHEEGAVELACHLEFTLRSHFYDEEHTDVSELTAFIIEDMPLSKVRSLCIENWLQHMHSQNSGFVRILRPLRSVTSVRLYNTSARGFLMGVWQHICAEKCNMGHYVCPRTEEHSPKVETEEDDPELFWPQLKWIQFARSVQVQHVLTRKGVYTENFRKDCPIVKDDIIEVDKVSFPMSIAWPKEIRSEWPNPNNIFAPLDEAYPHLNF